jgi:hypothetical protein
MSRSEFLYGTEKLQHVSYAPIQKARIYTGDGTALFRGTSADVRDRLIESSQHLLKSLNQPADCLICKNEYLPINNFRTWECALHPGHHVRVGHLTKWSCCGRFTKDIGCVACVHVDSEDVYSTMMANLVTATIEISKQLVDHSIVFCDLEMITNYPGGSLPSDRTYVLTAEGLPVDEILQDEFVYHISMVRKKRWQPSSG